MTVRSDGFFERVVVLWAAHVPIPVGSLIRHVHEALRAKASPVTLVLDVE